MTHHAKASSSGSSKRQGSRLGRAGIVAAFAAALVAFLGIGASAAVAAPPTLTIDPVTTSSITTAHVSGEVVVPADGNETYWCFEYTEEGQPTWSGFCYQGPVQPGESVPVEADLTNLKAATNYEVRLAALNFNEFVEEFSATEKFETDPAPVTPTFTLDGPEAVSYTSAHISGTFNPEGGNKDASAGPIPITAQLEVNREGAGWNPVGSSRTVEDTDAVSSEDFEVETDLTDLTPGADYRFRLAARYAGLNATSTEEGEFTTLPVAKPTITTPVISAITTDSAHFSAEVDPNGTDPAFDANWHFECTPSCGGLSGGTVSGAPDEVENDAKFLQPNTFYTVRLIASNAGGQVQQTETFQTAATGPLVVPFEAGPVHATSADLNGQVNPKGSSTVYWFEWGTADCAANPCTSLPAEQDASAGNGTSAVYVTRHLTGLTPATTYHFRLIAKNASGTTEGPGTTFTTPASEPACPNAGMLGADRLAACRAWEMASPPDKNGGDVIPHTTRTRAAADGSAVDFVSLIGFGDVHGGTVGTEYLARRTAAPGTSGWQTHGITPTQNPVPLVTIAAGHMDPAYDLLSPDLSAGVFRAVRPLTDVPDVAGALNLYVRGDLRTSGAGSYQLISDPGFAVPPLRIPSFMRPSVAGASSDLSRVIFESAMPLSEEVDSSSCNAFTGCPMHLYEWADGTLRLAGVLPDGSAAPSSQAGRGAAERRSTPHMISADGSRVFFQAPAGDAGNLYMRVDGTETVQLDASEREVPEEPQSTSQLWTASDDGTRVFFGTSEGLVDEDDDGSGDYYMYDTTAPAGNHLTLISKDGEPAFADSTDGIIGASDDGHYLYFMMFGQLIAGEDSLVRGVYAWHDGAISNIGRFAEPADIGFNTLEIDWQIVSVALSARVAADGSHLMFMTTDDGGFIGRGGFAGFDHGTACSGMGCRELYVYSADSGRLRCASCDPSGAPPTGRARVNVKDDPYASATASTPYLTRAISADGRWAFFSSPDALVPEDTNGNKYDAYTYDTVTERVSLLSSGTSDDDSYFMDASASGHDAFFVTKERLSGWDLDAAYDLYDARVGGGLPSPPPSPPPARATPAAPPSRRPRASRPSPPPSPASAIPASPNVPRVAAPSRSRARPAA